MHDSRLRSHTEAVGGKPKIVTEFPEGEVAITNFSNLGEAEDTPRRAGGQWRVLRMAQKAKYGGEFLPNVIEDGSGLFFVDFFQTDRDGNAKGIIRINVEEWIR